MTSEDIENRIVDVVNKVEEGNLCPLQTTIQLKKLEKLISSALAQIKDQAINEALKHGDKEFEFFGARVHVRSSATRYSYKHIDAWVELNNKLKEVEASAKDALKLKLKGQQSITEDGEIVEPADFTTGKETLFISL